MGFGCGGGSTCKAALKKFEESTGSRAAECPEIRLIGVAYRGIMLGYHMQGYYFILSNARMLYWGIIYKDVIRVSYARLSYWNIKCIQ